VDTAQGGLIVVAHPDDNLRFGGRNLQTPEPAPPGYGFSLLELMASVAILMVITGAVFAMIDYYQKAYGRTQLKADMYENVRGVAELMAQEIGQAGLVSLPAPPPTLSTAVSITGAASTPIVSSITSMFVGEQLLVDTGSNEELVTLTALNTGSKQITAVFAKTHLVGAPLSVLGVFPNGVVAPLTTDGSSGTSLRLFGDINADGSLVYVRYDCDTTAGTLTRSITTIVPTVNSLNLPQTLLTTLTANPAPLNTACFQYTTVGPVAGYTFVTNVAVTLSVQTRTQDPQTGQFLKMTKSFLNLAPRNVLIGLELANASATNRLQPTPANVLVY